LILTWSLTMATQIIQANLVVRRIPSLCSDVAYQHNL
jgi:hypothetical protein